MGEEKTQMKPRKENMGCLWVGNERKQFIVFFKGGKESRFVLLLFSCSFFVLGFAASRRSHSSIVRSSGHSRQREQ